MKAHFICVALVAFTLLACGDPETNDNRGYTKAPLENPTVVIRGEQPSDMSRLGEPNRVVAEEIELPEETATAQQQTPGEQAAVQLPSGVTQEMVTQGQQHFGGTCIACHGAAGAGGPLAPALNDSEWLHIDGSFDALVQIITDGVPTPKQFAVAMPPKGGAPLTDAQLREVAAYVFSISR